MNNYIFYLFNSVKSDFRIKFSRSKLGIIWAIIHPLAQVLIYALVLSAALSVKLPGISNQYSYAIYLISGMLCWGLFSEILSSCVGVFTANTDLIKKLSFPKIILPLKIVLIACVNNFLLFLTSCCIFFILGHELSIYFLFLPIGFCLTIILAFGFGVFFGVLNVFIRDVSEVFSVILQFAFWMTPIVYMVNIIPQKFLFILHFNPLLWIVEFYHDIFAYNKLPDFYSLLYPLFCACVGLMLAFFMYKKTNEQMADVL